MMYKTPNLQSNVQILLILGLLSISDVATVEASPGGVVVEEVKAGSALERAGLEPGDLLLSWERLANPPSNSESAKGTFGAPFDWMWLEMEQAPRGTVRLFGLRDGEDKQFEVTPGPWRGKVRPTMAGVTLTAYLEGWERLESGDLEGAMSRWAGIAESETVGSWMLFRMGEARAKTREWERAHAFYRSALEEAEEARARVAVWWAVGSAYEKQSEFDQATAVYESVRELGERTWGEQSLGVANSLHRLGAVAWRRGDLDRAATYLAPALEIRRKLAPGRFGVASSLSSLGNVAFLRGDLDRAADYGTQTLKLLRNLVPGSRDEARALNNLGNVAWARGDLDQAADNYTQALEIKKRLAPGSLTVAASLYNVGLVAGERGDLDRAADHFTQALEIHRKLAPGSLDEARSLNSLGSVAGRRGDLDRAAAYLTEAHEIRRKLAPGSLDVAFSLNNLGALARDRGDLDRAAAYLTEAHEIRRKLAPSSVDVAHSLNNLGSLAGDRGDLDRAADYYTQALEIRRKLAPDSLGVATSLKSLAAVAGDRGDLDQAVAYLTQALEIGQKLAPESANEAEMLYELGKLSRQQHKLQMATSLFDRALESLEGQVGKLGGSHETQAGFRAKHRSYYQDQIEVQLELNQAAEAFHTLERSRSQSFLAELAERDLGFSEDLSDELGRERRRANVAHDRILDQFSQVSANSPADERQELLKALQESRFHRAEIQARIRRESPRLAAVLYPEPLDLRSARELLQPGELLLSFSIGEEKSQVFAVGPKPQDFAALQLETNTEKLAGQVRRMRAALEPAMPAELAYFRGSLLWNDLFEPLRSRIRQADRLILVPDGPLHLLPFGALPESGTKEEPRYLIESLPLSVVSSTTVLRELRQKRRQRAGHSLVAFGAPHYSSAGVANAASRRQVSAELRSAIARGMKLGPLPHAQTEVESLARLFPEHSQVYIGAEATEEQAKALGKSASLIHFATHGLVNEHLPLETSLALTIPEQWREGEENGLLQVWEIYEHIRLEADLVTLSACETALGKELSGEGILGLTRAFQFASARGVVASLWSVNDQATAELMKRFYSHLRSGITRDEALRQAQMALRAGPLELGEGRRLRTRHPFYWAAFQLYGDWR